MSYELYFHRDSGTSYSDFEVSQEDKPHHHIILQGFVPQEAEISSRLYCGAQSGPSQSGAYCLATGVPRAYEGSPILFSSTPHTYIFAATGLLRHSHHEVSRPAQFRLVRLSNMQRCEAASVLLATRLHASSSSDHLASMTDVE